jgi:hypothetical protein
MANPPNDFVIPEPTYQRMLEVYNALYDLSFELAALRDDREEADEDWSTSSAGVEVISWLDDLQAATDALEVLEREPSAQDANLG